MRAPHLQGIISDLFPGVHLKKSGYQLMTEAIQEACAAANLQATPYFVLKVGACAVCGSVRVCVCACVCVCVSLHVCAGARACSCVPELVHSLCSLCSLCTNYAAYAA